MSSTSVCDDCRRSTSGHCWRHPNVLLGAFAPPLIQEQSAPRCGLCGGYGAFNRAKREPVPCIACGQKAEYAVLVPLDVLMPDEPSFAAPQRHGLRLIEGGGDAD